MSKRNNIIFSVVIVTYNSEKVIEKCIQSIRETNYDQNKIEVFVVDNDSKDKTKHIVRKKFKEVKIIKLSKNFGYAYACNRGIEKSSGQIVVLLNPDVIIDRGFFCNVGKFLRYNGPVGGVAPKMTDIKGTLLTYPKIPTILNRIYKYSGFYGILHHDEVLYHNLKNVKLPIVINNLEGPVAIFPRYVFKKIGLLNESFFLTHELTEFSVRLQKKGLKLYYLPSAEIVHFIGKSTAFYQIEILPFVHQAEILFFELTYGRILGFFVKSLIIFLLLIKIIPLFVYAKVTKTLSLDFNNRLIANLKLLKFFLKG